MSRTNMLGAEQSPRMSTDGQFYLQTQPKSQADSVDGIAYAYNMTPQPAQPRPHMDPAFYPPPWTTPGYGMFPFGPPGMMLPGIPPHPVSGDLQQCEDMASSNSHLPLTPKERKGMVSVSPPAPPSRERFSYTRYQLEMLNTIYTQIRYPNSMQKQLVAKRVGITREQVKIWFQNRRRKDVVGKTSAKDEYLQHSERKMVPDDVIKGVLCELTTYEHDPQGKKAKIQNKTNEERRTKQTQQKTSNCISPPNFSSPNSSVSLSSSNSPSSTINSEIADRLWSDNYQPNNEHVASEGKTTQHETSSYPFRSISELFTDSTNNLPLPMAGQAMALPVSIPVSHTEATSSGQYCTSVQENTNAVIDITPVVNDQELSPLRTITTLTPVTDGSDSSDTTYSPVSILSTLEPPLNTSSSKLVTDNLSSNIDISAPPNTVVILPHNIIPLKRPRDSDSSSEDDEQVEPPRKRQERRADINDRVPPNTIAPRSEPIKFNPVTIHPNSHPLTVDVPQICNSSEADISSCPETQCDQPNPQVPFLLAPVPLLPEPIIWPPPQWPPRSGTNHNTNYAFSARPNATEFGQYVRDAMHPPVKSNSTSEHPTSVFRDLYNMPQDGNTWDGNHIGRGHSDSHAKQNCEKSMSNQPTRMTAESPRNSHYGNEGYPNMGVGRPDMFPPWITPFSGSYCSFTHPVPPPVSAVPHNQVVAQQ